MKYLIGAIIGIVLVCAGYWAFTHYYPISPEQLGATDATNTATDTSQDTYPTPIADVQYQCDDGKAVRAVYFDEYVIVDLSGGTAAKLPHALSADGARYANSDESLVFWSRGEGAFVQEGGETSYANCVESDVAPASANE